MRRAPAIVACLVATLVLAAPALADSRPSDLRVATTSKIATLNPLAGTLPSEYRVWALNFDTLIAFDQTTLGPDRKESLALSWKPSPQGLTWTFHLRPNLHWSDGRKLTSTDVAWTMRFMKRRLKLSELADVKGWTTPNPTTVVAHLSHPFVGMNALRIYILPKHIWKAADTAHWKTFKPHLPLVGSGPYTVTSWNPGGTTTLTRNPHFWRVNDGPQRVLMRYYADPRKAITDLEQNRLDALPSDTIGPAQALGLERVSGVHLYRSPPLGLEYWVFDLAQHTAPAVHADVVQDQSIRTALAWAIDRSRLVQDALRGFGVPGNTQLPRAYGHFTLDLSEDAKLGYHYDPAHARQLLELAGWTLGRDGIRSRGGVRAEFDLAYAGGATERRAATLIRGWARAVGIAIDLQVDSSRKLTDLEDATTTAGKPTPAFDTELGSVSGDPAPELLLSLFTRAQIGARNNSGFVSTTYEKLYRQESSATNPDARTTAAHELQRIATERLPYIELYEADDIAAVNTRTWRHWTTQPTSHGQPLSLFGYATVLALRPGRRGTPGYPGVPWALAALVALAALALGSTYAAHGREAREPLEIADAPA